MKKYKLNITTLITILREFRGGKSVARTLMNLEISKLDISGEIIDVGGGGGKPSYLRFLMSSEVKIQSIDCISNGSNNIILDLEKDDLPFSSNSQSIVFAFNVFEHIFNYPHVITQIHRILKQDGKLIGYVPFLINYHPDPHDYFRFTNESLKKIFELSRFSKSEIIFSGFGPCVVAIETLWPLIPFYQFRFALFLICYGIDLLVMKIYPDLKDKFPLGYFFIVQK